MLDLCFPTPKTNDYQWRNLYLRQYGLCTYAPPPPKHPETTAPNVLKAELMQKRGIEVDVSKGGGNGCLFFNLSDDDEDSFTDAARDPFLSPRINNSPRRESLPESSVDALPVALENTCLEALTDRQLFSSELFGFLSRHDSETFSLLVSRSLRNSLGGKTVDSPNIEQFPIVTNAGRDVEGPKNNDDGDTQEKRLLKAPPGELLRLQRETWHLLMDNRIMAWFEREARERGRIAASVKQRLLEVVSSSPGTHAKVAFALPHDEGTKPASDSDDGLENSTSLRPGSSSFSRMEDERLMQTLDKFSPFFAVISPPEAIQKVMNPITAARRRERRRDGADIVGLPLFSQYATWREAYENRKVWRLAPFSFFLIHDCSYNHAHISALYVLLNMINSAAHTHTAECAVAEEKRQLLADLRRQRRPSGGFNTAESPQCPLMVTQQLTEDLLLAYEQSSSRTTLSMALHVQEFLTDLALDPDTASCFLSPEALRGQCEVDGGAVNGSTAKKDAKNDASDENASRQTAEGGKAEHEEANRETASSLPTEGGETIDWSSLKHLNDNSFDDLFTLAYWFVDAEIANSLIPPDSPVLPATVSPPKKNFSLVSVHTVSSHMTDGKRSVLQNIPSESITTHSQDSGYIVGRTRKYDATKSIVEAITRYEVQRQRLTEMRASESRERALTVTMLKKQRKKRLTNTRVPLREESVSATSLSAETTLLSAPLMFISTYIRLHGATWLKELLERIFNILRRDSVLLYVNGSDAESFPRLPPPSSSSPQVSVSLERSVDMTLNPSRDTFRWRNMPPKEAAHYQRLERLEDLICQDIQYVMEEFFSALHGKRSLTRLPQEISVLLSSFCTTVHLHLLRQHVTINTTDDKPAISVRKCLEDLRQRRVTGGAATTPGGQNKKDPTERLIRSIENNRLARFILFDCWILPTINNAIEFGYLPEGSSNHLRWNLDAFARYLKILLHAPFALTDGPGACLSTSSTLTGTSQRGSVFPPDKKTRLRSDESSMPRCETLKLPSCINGIYDVSSGTLVQLLPNHGDTELGFPDEKFVFGDFSAEVEASTPKWNTSGQSSAELRRQWYDLSGAMSSLNESLGITGGDGEEAYGDDTDATPARILNIFCTRASNDISMKAVVREYEVTPSTAARCISKTFSLMSGQHPIVRQAYLSGALVGKFNSSPYLTCLNGVLLHPRTVSTVLENVYQNSFAFYTTLIKPLQDENLLSLISPLVMSKNDFPLVDSNELLALIAAVPLKSQDTSRKSEFAMTNRYVYGKEEGLAQRRSQIAMWEATTRRLLQKRAHVTTGVPLAPEVTLHPLIRRSAPTDPFNMLSSAAEVITQEMQRVPLCLDTWWRAMVVALTVKAMNVIEECGDARSTQWRERCQAKMQEVNKEHRGLCTYFTQHKGGRLDISTVKALTFSREKRRKSSVVSMTQSLSSLSKLTEQMKQQKSKKKKKTVGRGRRKAITGK